MGSERSFAAPSVNDRYPGQKATRIRRSATKMAQNYSEGWYFADCDDLLLEWKRVDAKYYKEVFL